MQKFVERTNAFWKNKKTYRSITFGEKQREKRIAVPEYIFDGSHEIKSVSHTHTNVHVLNQNPLQISTQNNADLS